MSSSTKSRVSAPMRSGAQRVGSLTTRIGNKISSVAADETGWSLASNTKSIRTKLKETPPERALRLGYIKHGEFGLKIAYDPEIISDKIINTIERGAYERYEGRRSKSFVKDGDRIIELGAGLGFLSALILKGHEIADYQLIEADPRLPAIMRRTHELNKVDGPTNIQTCAATCNEEMIEAGSVDFFVGEKFCASSLLGASNLKHTVEIPVVSLADVIRDNDTNVLLVDIEGAETDIFNGTPLGGVERIIMEIHPHRIGQKGVRDVFRNLDKLGFVYAATGSTGIICGFEKFAD